MTAPDAVPHRPRGRLRWWHVVLLVVGAVFALFGLLVALFLVNLYGGLDDVLSGDPPREGDPQVVAARRATAPALAADSRRLGTEVVAPALGEPATYLGGGEVRPYCAEGQHNWKIDDDYDLICDVQRVEVVAVEDRAGFRGEMAALDRALRRDGWVGEERWSMELVLADYWDELGPPAATESPAPGTMPSWPARPAGYSMGDLPSARYTKAVDGETRTLTVGWVEAGSPASALTYYEDRSAFEVADGRAVDSAELVGAVDTEGYAVVLTVSAEYFHE